MVSQENTKNTIGVYIVAIAIVWQGIGTAFIGRNVLPAHSTFITFIAFLAAAIIPLGIMSARVLARYPHSPREHKTLLVSLISLIWLNLYTAGAFCIFYIAATLVAPSVASVVETGVGPALVAAIMFVQKEGTAKKMVTPLIIIALTILFVAGSTSAAHKHAVLGLVLSAVAGSCAVGVLYSTRRAVRERAGALHIAASRFHAAWIISGIIVLLNHTNSIPHGSILDSLLIALVCVTAPILLLQWGITMVHPLISSLIIAWLPAIVMVSEIMMGGNISYFQIIVLLIIILFSVIPILKNLRA